MKLSSLAAILLALALLSSGCANDHQQTYERETVEKYETEVDGDVRHYEYVEEEKRHVDGDDDDYCNGVLGCSVEVVGDVIAFPFRAVSAAIEFIF